MKTEEKELTTNCEELKLSHRIIRISRDSFGDEETQDVIPVKHIREAVKKLEKHLVSMPNARRINLLKLKEIFGERLI